MIISKNLNNVQIYNRIAYKRAIILTGRIIFYTNILLDYSKYYAVWNLIMYYNII